MYPNVCTQELWGSLATASLLVFKVLCFDEIAHQTLNYSDHDIKGQWLQLCWWVLIQSCKDAFLENVLPKLKLIKWCSNFAPIGFIGCWRQLCSQVLILWLAGMGGYWRLAITTLLVSQMKTDSVVWFKKLYRATLSQSELINKHINNMSQL